MGFFDSGVGGLSIWLETAKLMPNENSVYYADSNNCPYGVKSDQDIQVIVKNITEFLINDQNRCKIIVVACNTASGIALNYLRSTFPNYLFVGIEPAIKLAAQATKSKVIGVLATAGTFRGTLFNQTYGKYCKDIEVIIEDAKGLAQLVEEGKFQTDETRAVLKKYLDPMITKKADQIVLGCTHYPFLIEIMQEILPKNVNIINPAPAVAKQIERVLVQNHLRNENSTTANHQFFVNGNPSVLKSMMDKFYTTNNYKITQRSN
ncbi:MAG: glutamate racemase [Bacteriovoracaceae bacterium]